MRWKCTNLFLPPRQDAYFFLSKQGKRRLFPIGPRYWCTCAKTPDGRGAKREKDCPRCCWCITLFGCHRHRTGVYWPSPLNRIDQALSAVTMVILRVFELIFQITFFSTCDLHWQLANFILFITTPQEKCINIIPLSNLIQVVNN